MASYAPGCGGGASAVGEQQHGPGGLRGSAAFEASAVGAGGQNPSKFRRFLSDLLTCSCLRRRRQEGGDSDLLSPPGDDVFISPPPFAKVIGAEAGGAGGSTVPNSPREDSDGAWGKETFGLGGEGVSGSRGGGVGGPAWLGGARKLVRAEAGPGREVAGRGIVVSNDDEPKGRQLFRWSWVR